MQSLNSGASQVKIFVKYFRCAKWSIVSIIGHEISGTRINAVSQTTLDILGWRSSLLVPLRACNRHNSPPVIGEALASSRGHCVTRLLPGDSQTPWAAPVSSRPVASVRRNDSPQWGRAVDLWPRGRCPCRSTALVCRQKQPQGHRRLTGGPPARLGLRCRLNLPIRTMVGGLTGKRRLTRVDSGQQASVAGLYCCFFQKSTPNQRVSPTTR